MIIITEISKEICKIWYLCLQVSCKQKATKELVHERWQLRALRRSTDASFPNLDTSCRLGSLVSLLISYSYIQRFWGSISAAVVCKWHNLPSAIRPITIYKKRSFILCHSVRLGRTKCENALRCSTCGVDIAYHCYKHFAKITGWRPNSWGESSSIPNRRNRINFLTYISILLNRWAIWAVRRRSKSAVWVEGNVWDAAEVVVVVAVGEVDESMPLPTASPPDVAPALILGATLASEPSVATSAAEVCSNRRWSRSNSQEDIFRRRRPISQASGTRARDFVSAGGGGTWSNGVSVNIQEEDVLARHTGDWLPSWRECDCSCCPLWSRDKQNRS